MLYKINKIIPKAKFLLMLPVALLVIAVSVGSASASLGPVTYNSTLVTFKLPGSEPAGSAASQVYWELTLWHHGVMEGRETGTQGQILNIIVPNVQGCNFQIDARNLTVSPNIITYSARPVIPDCGGQSDVQSDTQVGSQTVGSQTTGSYTTGSDTTGSDTTGN